MNMEEQFIDGVKSILYDESKEKSKTVLIKTDKCIYLGELVWLHFDGEFYHAEMKYCYKFTNDKQPCFYIHKNIFTGTIIKTVNMEINDVLNNFLKDEEE